MRIMKIVPIMAGALLMLLSGCKKEEGTPLGNLGGSLPSDSLIYYFGLIQGSEYWHDAMSDTTLRSDDARRRYLKGLRDGIDAVRQDNKIYNKGLRDGMEMGFNLYNFNRKYKVDLDRQLLIEAITYALRNDTIVDEAVAMKEFERLLTQFNTARRERLIKDAKLLLSQKAEELKMTGITDELYMRVVTEGKGAQIKRNNLVFVSIDYNREDGSSLGLPTPEQLRVGRGAMREVMTEMFTHMKVGETAECATVAGALFGHRCERLGLSPKDVILINVTVNNAENPDTTRSAKNIAI